MRIFRLIIAVLLLVPATACTAQPSAKEAKSDTGNSDKIDVYYFHFTLRCEACLNIEARAKESLETLYPNHIKTGLITFNAYNLDEAPNREMAKKLGIYSQALLIVKGNEKINLTNEGFLYATVKPEKFKEIINEKIDGLMIR